MGFSSLATYVIMFAIGMSIFIGLLFSYKAYFVRSAESLEATQEINQAKLNSAMEIMNYTYNQTEYAEKFVLVDSQTEFELGIFDNITSTEEVGWLRLEASNTTGDWYSDIYVLNHSMNYTNLTITGIHPGVQAEIHAQIRSANSEAELTGDFLGPDGTSASVYDVPEVNSATFGISDAHNGHTVVQIKIYLYRQSDILEPRVDKIELGHKSSYILSINVKNDGKIKLDKEILELFIDQERISRNRIVSAEISSETDIINPGLWDSEEIIMINISSPIDSGKHRVSVINEYGIQDSELLTI